MENLRQDCRCSRLVHSCLKARLPGDARFALLSDETCDWPGIRSKPRFSTQQEDECQMASELHRKHAGPSEAHSLSSSSQSRGSYACLPQLLFECTSYTRLQILESCRSKIFITLVLAARLLFELCTAVNWHPKLVPEALATSVGHKGPRSRSHICWSQRSSTWTLLVLEPLAKC